jgi:hypothetical protein
MGYYPPGQDSPRGPRSSGSSIWDQGGGSLDASRPRSSRQIRQRHRIWPAGEHLARNLKVAHSLARKIKAGAICVNIHNYGDPAWPFGGFKQSGWGREMGQEVMEHYTETKSVASNLV